MRCELQEKAESLLWYAELKSVNASAKSCRNKGVTVVNDILNCFWNP